MTDTPTYTLQFDDILAKRWVIINQQPRIWVFKCDAFLAKADTVMSDLHKIEKKIRDQFPNAYTWREAAYSPGFAFDRDDEIVFRLTYCGHQVDEDYLY